MSIDNDDNTPNNGAPVGKVIRDKAFAKRLELACEGNARCPTDQYRGKQKWLYETLEEEFGVKVSSEAVRKWFAGETRPRPKVMSNIAQLLEVDESWLSLGITPQLDKMERKRRNAMADGAVNLVAGMLQLIGGHIAFLDEDPSALFAIVNGKRVEFVVSLATKLNENNYSFKITGSSLERRLIAVIPQDNMVFKLVAIQLSDVAGDLVNKGGYFEFTIEQRGFKWKLGDSILNEVTSIKDLA